MKHTSFYSKSELSKIGLNKYGSNVLISRKASIYSPDKITLGNNIRIDDFCILSGDINIGNYVHVSSYCALFGKHGIIIGDYSGLSPRTTIFSAVDDFSGEYMISPMVPPEFTNVTGGLVKISSFVQIGANTIIMPSVAIGEGAAVGAFTFVNNSLKPWTIYCGIPARKLKSRSRKILKHVDML